MPCNHIGQHERALVSVDSNASEMKIYTCSYETYHARMLVTNHDIINISHKERHRITTSQKRLIILRSMYSTASCLGAQHDQDHSGIDLSPPFHSFYHLNHVIFPNSGYPCTIYQPIIENHAITLRIVPHPSNASYKPILFVGPRDKNSFPATGRSMN